MDKIIGYIYIFERPKILLVRENISFNNLETFPSPTRNARSVSHIESYGTIRSLNETSYKTPTHIACGSGN